MPRRIRFSQTAAGQKEWRCDRTRCGQQTADTGKGEFLFHGGYSNEVDGWTAMIDEANRQLEAEGKILPLKSIKFPV